MTRSYSELSQLKTLLERYEYLRLDSTVGDVVFGHERELNQRFYRSGEWRRVREFVVGRDLGQDLGAPGHDIPHVVHVHHINPITKQGLRDFDSLLLDPENLISVSPRTHNAIHFSDARLLPEEYIARRPGDTKLW